MKARWMEDFQCEFAVPKSKNIFAKIVKFGSGRYCLQSS